ncbi:MAG: hypothetical protein DRG82_07475 [Deltaproteobacteria bacterium]|nr:MAG: hypothetical protein DRG82_07475 [Deltaproteobacteria bacterium]
MKKDNLTAPLYPFTNGENLRFLEQDSRKKVCRSTSFSVHTKKKDEMQPKIVSNHIQGTT